MKIPWLRSVRDRLSRSFVRPRNILRLTLVVFVSTAISNGYTVLTHEAIIDSVWDTSVKPLLLKRFPNATPQELEQAHAYAYGGCIIQDMGYYPFGNRFFSDLTHYVRSGNFVLELIKQSQDLDEYAFALGALEHYAADTEGHRIATNRAVPMLYPKLQQKYGSSVPYWDDPAAHIRTEFGFDVLQVAYGRYATDQYRNFIGFKVSRPLLERAFLSTYGIELKDVFGNVTLALGSYRRTVSSIIPGMTRVAWNLKKDQLQKEIPGITRKKFLYNLSRSSYEKEWGTEYHKPGFGTKSLTFLFRIVPTSGPFRALKIRMPTPQVEKMFMESFNATVDHYRALLVVVLVSQPELPNENLDVGEVSAAGKYKGTDEAYAKLLNKLAERKFERVSPELRLDILAYYSGLQAPVAAASTKKEAAESARLLAEFDQLRALPPVEP